LDGFGPLQNLVLKQIIWSCCTQPHSFEDGHREQAGVHHLDVHIAIMMDTTIFMLSYMEERNLYSLDPPNGLGYLLTPFYTLAMLKHK